MRKTLGAGLVLVVATSVLSFGFGPAQAASNAAAVLVGSGTISPGLTLTPTFQTATFFGAANGAGKINGKKIIFRGLGCNFNVASTIAETSQKGRGGGNGVCSGPSVLPAGFVSLSCGITYKRNIGVVTVSGTCFASGVVSGPAAVTAALSFEPTTVNPTTSYLLQGVAVLK